MQMIENETFGPIRLDVGGKHFANCKFAGTTLVYSGGKAPTFSGKVEFANVNLDFTGDAWEAFTWIRRLRAVLGPEAFEAVLAVPDGKGRKPTRH